MKTEINERTDVHYFLGVMKSMNDMLLQEDVSDSVKSKLLRNKKYLDEIKITLTDELAAHQSSTVSDLEIEAEAEKSMINFNEENSAKILLQQYGSGDLFKIGFMACAKWLRGKMEGR